MTDPIGTAQERELIEDGLDQAISGLEQCCITSFYAHGQKFSVADLRAAQSRIAEVGRPQVVTAAMIDAGVSFVCGADHTFGKDLNGNVSMTVLRNDVEGLLRAALSLHRVGKP